MYRFRDHGKDCIQTLHCKGHISWGQISNANSNPCVTCLVLGVYVITGVDEGWSADR